MWKVVIFIVSAIICLIAGLGFIPFWLVLPVALAGALAMGILSAPSGDDDGTE